MKFARVLAVSGALAGIGIIGIAATAPTTPTTPVAAPIAAADAYKVDPVHSAVIFKIKHMNASNFYGRFNGLEGAWTLDGEKTTLEFSLKTDNVDSGNPKRDDHLRSPDFFNAKEFPAITFKSTKVTKKGDNAYEVVGDLTLHGKTKPVTVALTHTGTAETKHGTRQGLEATFTIKRTDFGVSYGTDMLGDEVSLTCGISGVPAKDAGGAK